MFDLIKTEYKLPIPKGFESLFSKIDFEKQDFITYSFNPPALNLYSLAVDGRIYLEKQNGGIERVDYTGELEIESLLILDEDDYLLQYKILYYKGELKEIEISLCEKRDNKKRKEVEREILLGLKEKSYFARVFEDLELLYSSVICGLLSIVRYVLGLLFKFTWFLQRVLTKS